MLVLVEDSDRHLAAPEPALAPELVVVVALVGGSELAVLGLVLVEDSDRHLAVPEQALAPVPGLGLQLGMSQQPHMLSWAARDIGYSQSSHISTHTSFATQPRDTQRNVP